MFDRDTDVNTTADDGCATGGVCCFTAHAHRHRMQHTLVSTYTRVYPGDADDVVAGRPRPVQGELTVEVGRVYLITDKGLDLALSYPEPNSWSLRWNPPDPRDSSTLYRHGLGCLDPGVEIRGWYSSVFATPDRP